ncbi:MAG: bifunctional oligoribonuclease/PAP phosphatase NrnA [Gemmatimonadetes bacterium]|nr:bifunctional oligoribonuclease/PAP phosphatase NrnA [Gemmatimonadota bacterium]
MGYRTPAHRAASVKNAKNALLASRRAILTTHLNADGDGAGSEAALASWLRANGTEAWIINPTAFPDPLKFLVESEDWIVSAGSGRARDLCDQADLAVVLDTGELPRIGRVQEMISELATLVIDHHPPGDQPIGGVSFRDPTASATAELVYDVIAGANGPWNDYIVQGIYVGILTDTGGFRFDNATAACHEVAADMVSRGISPEAMHERVYGRAPLRRYRLLQSALDTLEADPQGGVSWMTIPRQAFEAVGASTDDLEGIVDIPRSIEGTEVGLLFRQTQSGEVKISFRSNGPVDVNVLARRFRGGGHVKAAGAVIPGPLERAIEEVIAATREAVANARAQGASV